MINNEPKVSIIIPFNNVEHYIGECLNSVVNQTLKELEIILINDNSTDNSRKIALDFALKDDRIKIIDINERKGQGFARNRGMEIAGGEYIGFVDSDDFVKENAFETLYNASKENDTDITMCQACEYDDINKVFINSDYYLLTSLNSYAGRVFSAEDTKDIVLNMNVALWNKIYKRTYLQNISGKFPEGFIYEDLPFFFGTYLPAERIKFVNQCLYNYRVNRKNSTMQQFNNKILDRLPMVSLAYEKLKSFPYMDDMRNKIQGWIIDDLFHRYTLLKENYHKEFFFQMKKIFESLEIENKDDPFWKQVYHFKGYLLVMNNTFDEFNQKVFNEYLDIHEVEYRLKSSAVSIEAVDNKLRLIYGDIEKNYKYTEKIVGFVDAKADKLEIRLNDMYNDLTGRIKANGASQGCADLDKSINEKTKQIASDIKDLSYVVYNNRKELDEAVAGALGDIALLKDDLSALKQFYENKLELLKEEYNQKYSDNELKIRKTELDAVNKISCLESRLEAERVRNNRNLELMKQFFEEKLIEEQKKHDLEKEDLKNEFNESIKQMKDELRSPLSRLFTRQSGRYHA